MGYYEDLGVDKDTTKEEMKKAYKAKSKKTHPDLGGNRCDFEKVKTAYEVLSDPIKKERYDNGEDTDLPPIDDLARSQLMGMFVNAVSDGTNIEQADIIGDLEKQLEQSVVNLVRAEQRNRKVEEKWNKVKVRLRHDGSISDVFGFVIKKELDKVSKFDVEHARTVLVLNKMKEMVDTYEYKYEKGEHTRNMSSDYWFGRV